MSGTAKKIGHWARRLRSSKSLSPSAMPVELGGEWRADDGAEPPGGEGRRGEGDRWRGGRCTAASTVTRREAGEGRPSRRGEDGREVSQARRGAKKRGWSGAAGTTAATHPGASPSAMRPRQLTQELLPLAHDRPIPRLSHRCSGIVAGLPRGLLGGHHCRRLGGVAGVGVLG